MRCSVRVCVCFAGVRRMSSLLAFTSLCSDPGCSRMCLMRAINILEQTWLALTRLQPLHTPTHTHTHSHTSHRSSRGWWQEREGESERKSERETNKLWTKLFGTVRRRPPSCSPTYSSFHPLAIILQTVPECLPAPTLWVTAACVGVEISLLIPVIASTTVI